MYYSPQPEPGTAQVMLQQDKTRTRAAAFRATKLFPGPIGALISKELLSWVEFGYRFGPHSPILAVVDTILKTPIDA